MRTNERTGSNGHAQTIRVAIYARVPADGDFSELGTQIAGVGEHMEGVPEYIVGEVYSERGEPATRKEEADLRPEYLRMLADAEAGKFDLILTTRMSDFAGSVSTMLEAVRGLLKCGVGVKFLDERVHFVRSVDEAMLAVMEEVKQEQSSWWSRCIESVLPRKEVKAGLG